MTTRGARVLKRVRIASQGLFLAAFAWIFIRSRDPFAVVQNPFLALDPLIFLTHPVLSPLVLGTIGALLAAAVLLGRVFCGWVCPMGSLVDLVDLALSPLRRINPVRLDRWGGRKGLARVPPALFILGISAVTAFVMPPLLPFVHPNVWIVRIFSLSWLGLGFLVFVAAAAVFARRLWCVYLCPLGALYGVLGSFSLFGLRIDRCSDCGRCGSCPMEAADPGGRAVLAHQCTLCFDFEERCPVEGFAFGVRRRRAGRVKAGVRELSPTAEGRFDPSRRMFLLSAGVLAAGLAVGGLAGAARRLAGRVAGTRLLRPPGVTDEALFLQRCIRCLHCVQSCPTRIIRATGLEAGTPSLFTPGLTFEKQGCEYQCQVCQVVCPNAAIPLQTLAQKKLSVIGLAAIDESTCVVFKDRKQCLVCEELCPIPEKAIVFETRASRTDAGGVSLRFPVVVPRRCIGCGICQANCPASPVAITVRRT
jgi:polyferredoxin/Pyruvate/2-oxoacid:ferredoxin oxidoreductase delta subunit